MKVEVNVSKVVKIFKKIQEWPEELYEMICIDIRENVG